MKNIKKIIIVLIVAIIIIIIALGILLLTQKDSQDVEVNSEIDLNNNVNVSLVKDENEYHNIERIMNKYFTYINYLDYNFFQVQLDENQIQKVKKEYAEKGKNVLENILVKEYISKQNWESELLKYTNKSIDITEMNKYSYGQVDAYLLTISYEGDKTTNILVFDDINNDAFSILPNEYLNKISKDELVSIINEIDIQNIERNDDNEIQRLDLDDEQIAIQYYYDYINMLKNDVNKLYSKLDESYRNERFGNFDTFKEYIENNKEQLEKSMIDKYQVNKKSDYTEYKCVDENGKYYIFYATAAMKYTLFLDTYTVDLPEFIEQYNKSNDQEKVVLNISKMVTAINNEDYDYVYNKLADSFKNKYFGNSEELKEYLQNNLYRKIAVEYEDFDREGNIYTYNIRVIKQYEKDEEMPEEQNAPSKNVNIAMQLNEGTDFVMSFSIDE